MQRGGVRGVGGRAVKLTANNRPLSVRYVLSLQGISKVRPDCKMNRHLFFRYYVHLVKEIVKLLKKSER